MQSSVVLSEEKSRARSQSSAPARSSVKRIIVRLVLWVFPDEQFISLLKFELALLLTSVYSKLSPVEWIKRLRLRGNYDLKVNLGNGPFTHSGWLNLDCRMSLRQEDLSCDLRRSWPLRDGSAKYVFAEHVLEHFAYPDEINHILKECHRVLRKGGVLRAIVPNTERYLRSYTEKDEDFVRQVTGANGSNLSLVNVMMRENGFHKYAYDYEELERTLKRAGFETVMLSTLRHSVHEDLNIDLNEPIRELVSLYIEAVKT